jgi:hypothetical protein
MEVHQMKPRGVGMQTIHTMFILLVFDEYTFRDILAAQLTF